MAERGDSLPGFDVNDLFRAFEEKGGFMGAFAPPASAQEPPLLSTPETDPNFTVQLQNFQLRILIDHFNGRTLTDIRKDALDFKKSFESGKKTTLSVHGTLGKKLYEHTTLENLESLAKEKHEEFARKSGRALSDHEHKEMQREADMWAVIYQHAQAAAEIKDD